MAAVGDSELSPITNVYGKPFTKILCLLPTSLGVSVEDFRRSRLPPDHWIDTRKFLTRRRELPSGIFELFGNFSDESAYTVRNNMIQWVQDNRGNFEIWTSIIRRHKKLSLAEWVKWMSDEETPGDEIALYALSRMYNRHVIVYTKKYHWTTVVHRVHVPEEEVAGWCDIHLLFIKSYVFGEIKRIRKPSFPSILPTPMPKTPTTSSVITGDSIDSSDVIPGKGVITGSASSESAKDVIPENSGVKGTRPSRRRTRTVLKLPAAPKIGKRTPSSTVHGGMHTRSSARTAQTSKVLSTGRRVKNINYSDMDAAKLEGPDPTKKKKTSYRATKEPSLARIAAHKKTMQERSIKPQQTKTHTESAVTAIEDPTDKQEDSAKVDHPTLSIPGRDEQDEAAANVLLTLGENLPEQVDDELDENAKLMPIGGAAVSDIPHPENETTDLPVQQDMSSKGNATDKTQHPDNLPNTNEDTTPADNPETGAKPKSTKQKGTFTMKRHVLPKPSADPRKFHCPFDNCQRSTNTAGELNAHYRRRHPPVKCPICGRAFDTPSSLNKHKYTHSAPSHICDHCGECFHFKSQYDSHIRKHLKNPSYQCMSSGCGKWFKRSGELKAHLVVHSGEVFTCEEEGCNYSTNDPRNLRAHLRSHSDAEPFKCIFCGEGHRYEEQKK